MFTYTFCAIVFGAVRTPVNEPPGMTAREAAESSTVPICQAPTMYSPPKAPRRRPMRDAPWMSVGYSLSGARSTVCLRLAGAAGSAEFIHLSGLKLIIWEEVVVTTRKLVRTVCSLPPLKTASPFVRKACSSSSVRSPFVKYSSRASA